MSRMSKKQDDQHPIGVVFMGRDDGDWEFYAAFNAELCPADTETHDHAKWLEEEGEEPLIMWFDEISSVPQVLVYPSSAPGQSKLFPNPQYRTR